MRNLVQSMLSCTWALSVFGVQQAVSIIRQLDSEGLNAAAQSMGRVINATARTLSGATAEVFAVGAKAQQTVLEGAGLGSERNAVSVENMQEPVAAAMLLTPSEAVVGSSSLRPN